MHGVSEVIAIILILMITIAIAGLAYTFMSSTAASTTSAASASVTTTTSSMLTSFVVESMDISKLHIRNTGQSALTNLLVYVNDEPAMNDITPTTIAPGQIGTVTIYSFIPDGATIKLTSPSGFSASKVANPCSKAIGCWKLDEASGLIAYDSSSNGNSGSLINMSIITNQFDPFILIIEEESCGTASSTLYNALVSSGFTRVVKNTSITRRTDIDVLNPDVIIASDHSCAINNSTLLNELYLAGYNVFTKGNDHTSSIRPIVSYVSTNVNAPTITVNTLSGHPITQGWTTSGGSGADSRNGITAIHPSAIDIADDVANNFIEAIYLHEDGRGGWYHQQASSNPTTQLLKNAMYYLGSYPLASSDNATSGWDVGMSSSGIKLDGVNDFVSVSGRLIPANTGTIECWVKLNNVTGSQIIVYTSNGTTSAYNGFTGSGGLEMHTSISANTFSFVYEDGGVGGSSSPVVSTTSLSTGVWYHIAVTYNLTTANIFVNGILNATGSLSSATRSNIEATFNAIGRPGVSDRFFNGTVDELRIYDRPIY